MIDPFSPWQESGKELATRTVGRDEPVEWLLDACERFMNGEQPRWCLVTGPRGAGKSHLLQLVRSRLSDPQAVTWVGEDTAEDADADALWSRIWAPSDPWGWTPPPAARQRRILFVEGFERLVERLKPEGRWTLRHHLQESGAFLVGAALSAELASASGDAFFGQLDTWRLEPLSDADARALFERVSGAADAPPSGPTLTRNEALVSMSGRSPRAVIVLAEAVRGTQGDTMGTAEGLRQGIVRLVTHYQQRFHDLPPLGQRVLEVVAAAPRALTASEVQQHCRTSSAALAGVARVLEEAGTLTRSPDPDDARVTRYTLSEPLFRYWLEYRNIPEWNDTRAAWLGRLLGEVLTRDEIANIWWSSPTEDLGRAIQRGSHENLLDRANMALLRATTREDRQTAVERASELKVDAEHALWFCLDVILRDDGDLLATLSPWGVDHDIIAALLHFAADLDTAPRARDAFMRLVRRLAKCREPVNVVFDFAVRELLGPLDPRGGVWELKAAEQSALAKVPHLRATFALQGRRATHEPLLDWGRLTAIPLTPSTPDLGALLAAAHQRRDAPFFEKVALLTATWALPMCPRPELIAPSPNALAGALAQPVSSASLSWMASLAGMSEPTAARVIAHLRANPDPGDRWGETIEVAALLALAVRAPSRFEAVAKALGEDPAIAKTRRTLHQLQERERGPLHPELERVWQAVSGGNDPQTRLPL